jgi:hypothetical protein
VLLPKLVLKFHWKAKDVALSEARKNSKVLGASALQDGDSRQSVMDGQQHVMGAALRMMEAAGGNSAEASRAAERRPDEGPGGVAGPGVQQLRGLSQSNAPARNPGQPPPPPPPQMDGRAARSQPEQWH